MRGFNFRRSGRPPEKRGWCAYFRPGVSAVAFPLPEPVHLGKGHEMDTPQAPPDHLERHPPTLLLRRVVAGHGRDNPVQPGEADPYALPLPGNSDPGSMADHGMSGQPRQ